MSKKTSMYLHRSASGAEPSITRGYDRKFKATPAYRRTLPDMMEAAHDAIQGALVPIQQVGVHNFRLPLKFRTKQRDLLTLEARVTGTVSLEADLKGINMSRIVRSFYEHKDNVFTGEWMGRILRSYLKNVKSKDARLKVGFSYPMLHQSLRSGLKGYQYYEAAFEGVMTRALCLRALQTETQVMVKREDEQAFAELNGAHLKFVEDAARLLYREFDADKRIRDFQIACSHLESLHSHDAVSVICKGVPGGLKADFMDFGSLVC